LASYADDVVLFLIDDRVPSEPRNRSRWRDEVPWRGIVTLAVIVGLCVLGAVLAPAEGLASVTIAAALGCRLCARLGDWRGMKDHRQ
jgi:hypothetical protein